MSFYSVGISALNAAQLGMSTTGHNIANVSTEGYHRQQIVQSTNIATLTGNGFVGQGTQVDTIKRVYSEFLDAQVLQGQAQSAHLDAYLGQIKQIDNMLADSNVGLSPALQTFYSAVGDVGANPQAAASRQALLSNASALVTRFQTLSQRVTEIRNGINSQIAEGVTLVNSYAKQISDLNEQIVLQVGTTSQPPNDLLDQREKLVSQLNLQVKTTTVKQNDGSYNVYIGNGQPLVVGQQVYKLAAVPSPEDQQRIEVAYQYASGNTLLGAGSLTGGRLGGLLDFRNNSLDAAQNALGRVAMGLAQTFNDQHKLGQDLAGNLGGDFFSVPSPTVIPSTGNTGAGSITASLSNVQALTTSDYRISYNGTNYTVTDLAANTSTMGLTAAALATAIPGLTLAVGAVPAAGDIFTIQPTRYAARDIALSSNINTTTIAAAAPIRTAVTSTNTGSGKISAGTVNTGTPVTPNPAHPSTDLNLQQPVTITFNSPATNFTVSGTGVGLPATVAYTAGANISFNGWTVQITGAPAAGDKFTVGPNTNGVSDNRNALALAQLQTKNTLVGGTATFQGAYSQLVSQVGNKTAETQVTSTAQTTLVDQTKTAQQALSGVNLDEEAANLLRYQQAYQAAGKMLQIAASLFDTLLAIGR
ncbi:MAG TPA: flagellar hook-associated protein FlgK [Novimethylophilus sp.]|jgi:flagellar hook-associated protein 1 FlgK|uniref:flagellar hook-associated protein FlgK n=1 Tax=Novimethylophilus sp. TaxID=2137426 RepID=UPI002F42CB21